MVLDSDAPAHDAIVGNLWTNEQKCKYVADADKYPNVFIQINHEALLAKSKYIPVCAVKLKAG